MNQLPIASIIRRHILSPGIACLLLVSVFGMSSDALGVTIRGDFNSNTLAANDDGSTGLVSLGFTADFFGTNYTDLFVNNNGNVTFDAALGAYTPFDLSTTGRVIIAPFFADVDTRGIGDEVTYGTGTVDGKNAFGVNWVNVAHFDTAPPLNSFQMVLIDRSGVGAGDFDIEFNYGQILWETGQASGGDLAGLGGDSARVGYSNGSAASSFELPGSAVNGAFLDGGPATTSLINNRLNSNLDGRYVFNVRNGVVVPPQPVPEPTSIAIFGIGALGLVVGGMRRRKQKQSA